MSFFDPPAPSPPTKPATDEVTQRIVQSVAQFEARWANFGMAPFARANGWIAEYRKELEEVAAIARQVGRSEHLEEPRDADE